MKEYIAEYIVPVVPADEKGKNLKFDFMNAKRLIQCRDCKYAEKMYITNLPWLKQWEYSCTYFNTHSVMGDGFCSQAKRRGEE